MTSLGMARFGFDWMMERRAICHMESDDGCDDDGGPPDPSTSMVS